MENRSVSIKELTRGFFMRFMEDFDDKETKRVNKIREMLERSLNSKAFTILQVESSAGTFTTLSGFILRFEPQQNRIVLKANNDRQFHMIELHKIRKVTLRKN
ncbi:MAG: hypothetical protein LBV67_00980 [Streptococcaceae bacterium]|jgi:hypothetical protein|nr:hypothetical protein [Streptococcaceae bacterium]